MGERQLPELYPGWKTIRKLGSGSFGTVYEIERDLFGKIEKAALKCIAIPQNDGDVEEMYSNGYDDASITAHFETYLANIVREYSMMVEMKGHTNVVYCDDIRYVPREDGIGWDITIKMELLTPLIKTLGPDFGEEQVIRLGKDLCRALALCKDRDIVHRDIKPQNIFVSKTGDYKLGDFGIAKTVEQTTGGTKIGTYSYMAPEVYHNKPYGSSADIYSLGLVMYWLLNERRLPFLPLPPKSPTYDETETARHRRFMGEEIPAPQKGSEELKRIVLKACAFEPQDRFASAQEMLDALDSMGQTEPVVNKMDIPEKTAVVDAALDETCGPVFGTISTAAATMTEGPVFRQKPAAEEKPAVTYSVSSTEHMGPRTIDAPKRVPQPVEAEPARNRKPWIIAACAAVVLAVIGFAFYSMYHIWSDPTCTAPATCSICNKTQGEAMGHRWVEADCVNAEYCSVCGEMGVGAFGHSWKDYDCMTAKTCGTCGYTSGELGEHNWMEATKTAPATCSVCGITDGTPILPTVKMRRWWWDGNVDDPECDQYDTTGIVTFPSWGDCDNSSVRIQIKDAYNQEVPLSDFRIEWEGETVYITPTSAVPIGTYKFEFFSQQNGSAGLNMSYGYNDDIYLQYSYLTWSNCVVQNRKNQRYLVRENNELATKTEAGSVAVFSSDKAVNGTKFMLQDGSTLSNNGKTMRFTTQQYRPHFDPGNYMDVLVYDGYFLASDASGNLYLTKELVEECYWDIRE